MLNKFIDRGIRFARERGFEVRRILSADKDAAVYRSLYSKKDLENRAFLNIGAGGFYHPLWTNVDHSSDWYAQMQTSGHVEWDLMSMVPCAVVSDTINAVYSSCTIEHVSDEAALYMLKEAYRMLKPGGVCRIVAPDAVLLHDAYKRGDAQFFANEHGGPLFIGEDATLEEHFLHSFASQRLRFHPEVQPDLLMDTDTIKQLFSTRPLEDALRETVSPCSFEIQTRHIGNHINWWTRDKAIDFIKQAGFREVGDSAFGQSRCPVMRNTGYFDNSWSRICFYTEAVK